MENSSKKKPSRYNIFFKYEDLNIGFNSFTFEYIVLDPLLLEMYTASVQRDDFSELRSIHRSFYDFLIDQGFLVDETIDEFEVVKATSLQIDNDPSHYSLIVNPTMNCNFKCWYCYETHIKDSKMSPETIKSIVKYAKNIIETQVGLRSFSLSFFGGEPLLYFDKVIVPILTEVSELCASSGVQFSAAMTTNGLLIDQEMLTTCIKYNLTAFQITLDGHRDQHDKVRFISEGKGSYDKIMSNIILVANNDLVANVRINCSKETMTSIKAIANDLDEIQNLHKGNIHIDVHKVWQVTDDIDGAIDEARFYFKEKGYNVRIGSYDTVLNSCYADKYYQATVNYNGEVFKCTARDFTSTTKEGILDSEGNLLWNDKFEKRISSKFRNPPCKECRILPLCGGGCTQQALEHEGVDYCIYNFDEDAKTQVVINKFKDIVLQG